MKITFKAEKEKVICVVESNTFPIGNWKHSFNIDLGKECYALLLAHHLTEALGDRIEAVRREEYDAGYKAGNQKRRKKTWFSRFLRK